MSKKNRNRKPSTEQVETPTPTEVPQAEVEITTEAQLEAEADAQAQDDERERRLAEAQAEHDILGPETPSVTETARARGNKRFTVGSAIDTTVFRLGGPKGEPKARPQTLAGALYDELKVNGAGTCSELVDRLNATGVYERVALKSATLRPYSSVMYWLKTWRAAGLASVVIPEIEAEEPTVEAPQAEAAVV